MMNITWKLQDAKSQFSKVVEEALHHGPQYVTRRGIPTVVIVSVREYEALTTSKPSFQEFLLSCPTIDHEMDLKRTHDYPRSLDL
jgi:prevent-host-death family protein